MFLSQQREAETETRIADDGKRYATKKNGTMFGGSGGFGGGTMSCFRCGKHRPTSELEMKRFVGKLQRVCKGDCA